MVEFNNKVCVKCKNERPINYFWKDPNRKDGRFPYCKECTSRNKESFLKGKYNKENGLKYCPDCKNSLPLSKFGNNRSTASGKHNQCRTCAVKRKFDWESKNVKKDKEAERRRGLRKYGITTDDYNSMLVKQDGKCAICKTESSGSKRTGFMFVDHCHKTGKIRGLLCLKCNQGIGMFNDNVEIMKSAIKYLED